MNRSVLLAAVLLAGAPQPSRAQEPVPSPSPSAEDELTALLAILEQETAVATTTRLNNDFVPGLVTVLQGEEMRALGFATVWDALSLVPGIQTVRGNDAAPSLVVRGIEFPFNSGNVKVLVDSVPLSREAAGINGVVLLLPLEQVDRIEVIRGPGSVVYGDFAFMGLVNIVTRQGGRSAYARHEGGHTWATGGHASGRLFGVDTTARLSAWTSDDAPVPEPRQAREDGVFGALSARRGGFAFTAQGIARDVDDGAGGRAAASQEQEHWALDARHRHAFSPRLALTARAAFLHNRYDPGRFRGSVTDLAAGLTAQRGRHDLLLEGALAFGRIDRAVRLLAPVPGQPPPTPLVLEDLRRNVRSVLAQDRIELGSRVSLTVGARYDHYGDVDARVTPRASVVWRATDRHILKVQHAEGFRAPTFFELYGSGRALPDLDFEVNATTELHYTFRRPSSVFRATLFRTDLRDVIFVRSGSVFDNSRFVDSRGAEVEWEQRLGSAVKVQANVSWIDEEENRNLQVEARRSLGAPEWLANAALSWRVAPRHFVYARWSHVGARSTADADDTLDVAWTVRDLPARGVELRAGARNVFDSEVVYVVSRPSGADVLRYPGRTVWVELAVSR